MAKNKKAKEENDVKPSDHKFDISIENALANRVVLNEYQVAETNAEQANNDYQSYIDMLSCERTEKNYDWRSDVSVPEFTTLHLIQQGLSATQNFSTRDFTEVYIGDSEVVPAAEAEKRLINNTLNLRELYYYQKLLRATSAKDLDGATYFRCWWEQKVIPGIIGTEVEQRESETVDIHGDPLIDRATQIPGLEFAEVPVEGEVPVIDRFNFDVIDRRDIFTSGEYTYSLQQNKWVIIRYNATLPWMVDRQEEMGYFNLDVLRNAPIKGDERGKGTHTDYYGTPAGQESDKSPIKDWLIVERYGDDWVTILKDKDGEAIGIEPGINKDGEQVEGAVLVSVISAFAISGGNKILIRVQQNPYRSAKGETYIPLIRGLAYVHPTKADGMGDDKCSRELQIAIDDTVNVSNDRVMLGTLNTFIGRKGAIESNDTIFMEPEHVITVEDPVNDIRELKISSDVGGAMSQAQFFSGKMQQLQAVDPTSVSPVQTATAEARDQARTTTRNQYKELSLSNTLLNEFYWMISQMHWQFATEQTLIERIGADRVQDYDPSKAYAYKPITSAIETEHGKAAKNRILLQTMQIVGSIENRNTPAVINDIVMAISTLNGAEFESLGKRLLDESQGGGGGKGDLEAVGQGIPTQNQEGLSQSDLEQSSRENSPGQSFE